jgi:hypothetical protein
MQAITAHAPHADVHVVRDPSAVDRLLTRL